MKVTIFSSLQCDTKHFKHVMNTMKWDSLKYPSNVNLILNMRAGGVLVIYVRTFSCTSLGK